MLWVPPAGAAATMVSDSDTGGHIPSRPTVVGFSDNGGFFIQERRARSPVLGKRVS